MTSVAAALAWLLVPSTVAADSGDWWCDAGWKWKTDSIPVRVHGRLADFMQHEDESFWTDDELQREVEFVLERLVDQAASAIPPLFFAGFEPDDTAWDADTPGNSIAIRPNLEPGDCRTGYMNGKPGGGNGVRIFIGQTRACDGFRWEHWSLHTSGGTIPRTFGGLLMHELIHAVGFSHWGACQDTPPACTDNPGEPQICGAMQAHGLSSEYYELEHSDANALRRKYGVWEFDGNSRRESVNSLDWSSLPPGGFKSGPYAAADWANPGSFMPIVTTDDMLRPHMWLYSRTDDTFLDWGVADVPAQYGPVATASSSSPLYRYAFYMSEQFEYFTMKFPFYSYHSSATTKSYVPSPWLASRQGHGGTFDPRTGRLIHVWRGIDNEIQLALSEPASAIGSPSTHVALTGDGNAAAYTPSVSCGHPTIADNCILVWASSAAAAGEHYHILKWTQFHVLEENGIYSFRFSNPVYSLGYIQFGPPSVTYKGPANGRDAFVVAWKNPGRCYYTLRKSADVAVPFSDERSHCGPRGAHNGPPMSGATLNRAEAWASFNRED